MSLKKLGVILVAVLALGAVVASNAMALKAVESNGFWYHNTVKLAPGATNGEPLTCSIGSHNGETKAVLQSTVGTNNVPLKLTATGVSCPGGMIFNEGSKAKATGKIKFTGVTVSEPAGCSVTGGTVETVALKAQVWMEEAGGAGKTYVKFEPEAGTTFATVHIEGCAIANFYPVTGVVFGEAVDATTGVQQATGTEAATQALTFSDTINTTASGLAEPLKFGGHAAKLTGRANFVLTNGGNFSANET